MTPVLARRTAGVLLHPSSLPGPHGVGDLGATARAFVDWLVSAGCSVWQVLPLVPVGAGHSPYSSAAALAGNSWLIDLEALVADGLLDALPPAPAFPSSPLDVAAMTAYKLPLLARAADRLIAGHPLHAELQSFAREHAWVQDVALYFAAKETYGGAPWWEWPPALRDRAAGALAQMRDTPAYRRVLGEQFLFERQWQALRRYAHERGVALYGDVPIYVDWDSADVWVHRDQFQLDGDGAPREVSGVPPDYFSATGQLWGNPLYHWQAMARDRHAWWVARLKRVLAQVDLVRIDHFRAFAAYWAVPRARRVARRPRRGCVRGFALGDRRAADRGGGPRRDRRSGDRFARCGRPAGHEDFAICFRRRRRESVSAA
jgi:4-alpha-glucanotransferase